VSSRRTSCSSIPGCRTILLSDLFFVAHRSDRALTGSKPVIRPTICLLQGDVDLQPYFSTALYKDHNAMVRSFEVEARTLPSGE